MKNKGGKKENKKIVLLVDDNPDLLYSVKKGLESLSEDYGVVTAESGRKCLQSLKSIKPALILLDIMMPGMDGWDTCAKIKSNKKTENIHIVFLTAKTDPVSKSMGRLASADYITKPFDMKDLKKRIDFVVKSNRKK
jgi:two-component system alkaline phosphatase synthesis response regulator PhoP|tara:strand:+ start:73 stop:483 length:411 start_codon:yes stop_codon:yes gene_type:complete